MFINGEWCAAATGETIATVPDGGRADAAHAIAAADAAFPAWAGETAYRRSAILHRAWQMM